MGLFNKNAKAALLRGYDTNCDRCMICDITDPDETIISIDPVGYSYIKLYWHDIPTDFDIDRVCTSMEKIIVAVPDRVYVCKLYVATVAYKDRLCLSASPSLYSENDLCGVVCRLEKNVSEKFIDWIAPRFIRKFLVKCNPSLDAVNKTFDETETKMIKEMPVITRVIINNPGVIVFWSDDTKTIGKCMDGDVFNPEIGLSMAISRKYYDILGFPNPRSAFKNQLKQAEDQSSKTAEKKANKKKLKGD